MPYTRLPTEALMTALHNACDTVRAHAGPEPDVEDWEVWLEWNARKDDALREFVVALLSEAGYSRGGCNCPLCDY